MPQATGNRRDSQQLILRDGRRLGFAEYGDYAGLPVVYCHGWPSSRLEASVLHGPGQQMGLHIIAPDRPGYGLSDLLPGRKLADWPRDVRQLADHLGLKSFAVVGVSGGGPYAAACAANIRDRIPSTLLVASVGPCDAPGALEGMVALNRWLLSLARSAPWLAQKLATTCMRTFWGSGSRVIPRQIEERLPEADRRALADPALRAALIASSQEGLRHGPQAAAWDGLLLARDWGFALDQIRVSVHLWHGEKDLVVPPAMGRYLAKTIPGCQARFYPDDGHFSLPFTRMREILQVVKR